MCNRTPVIHHSNGGKFDIRADDWKMIEGPGSGEFTDPSFHEFKPGKPAGQLYIMNEDPKEKRTYICQIPKK